MQNEKLKMEERREDLVGVRAAPAIGVEAILWVGHLLAP
jgi:hypothetical protein